MCRSVHREMICIEAQHFNINRILLLAIGLWPYQRSKFAQFQIILFFGILISFIIVQLTTLTTAKYTSDVVIEILSLTLFFFMFLIKYNSFRINTQTIKSLLEQLQYMCNGLKDENEVAIIREYGKNAKLYTTRLALLTICSLFTLFCSPLWPCILDIFLPINESRPCRTLFVMTEYFVDQEKYFYLILLHINVAHSIGAISMIATGSMLVGYFKHICGMFRIASYRIEQAMMINVHQNINLKNEIMIYKEIIYAVDIHRKAINFSEFLVSNFEGSFFLLITISVICLSLNLFRIAIHENDIMQLLLHFIRVNVILTYMFLANYAGQEIIDHNNHVFFTVYNIRWYVAPLHIQKLILFILQRGTKIFTLNIGGLFVGSLETFAMLTSTSISYFTVLYSTR